MLMVLDYGLWLDFGDRGGLAVVFHPDPSSLM